MKPIKRPNMLSATFVKTVNAPGRYGDGRGGLGRQVHVSVAIHRPLAAGSTTR